MNKKFRSVENAPFSTECIEQFHGPIERALKFGLTFAYWIFTMKKTLITLATLAMVLLWSDVDAQRSQRRQQRKHRNTEQKLDELERNGKVDKTEAEVISEREDRYHRTKSRATRNGKISDHEHHKLTRQNRRLKRSVRRADD
jgi:hypothetical protein